MSQATLRKVALKDLAGPKDPQRRIVTQIIDCYAVGVYPRHQFPYCSGMSFAEAVDLTTCGHRRLHATMRALVSLALSLAILATGCGSSVSHPSVQASAKPEQLAPRPARTTRVAKSAESEQPSLQAKLPRNCMREGGACYPPVDFVRALCKKKYPGVAIAMFEKTAPWKHAFVKVKEVAPVNSLGGPTAHVQLEFLEEVLLLRDREVKLRQSIVDVPNSYDVLRFDGTCATLAEDEFMTKKPYVRPRYAPIIWQQIDADMRQALTQSSKVDQAAEAQTMACRGSFLAGGGEPCKDATQQLARAIVTALSEGLQVPPPSNLPSWSVASSAANPVDPGCPVNHAC